MLFVPPKTAKDVHFFRRDYLPPQPIAIRLTKGKFDSWIVKVLFVRGKLGFLPPVAIKKPLLSG